MSCVAAVHTSLRLAKVYVIEYVEDLRPELCVNTFRECEGLEHRKIAVVEPGTCERVSANIAELIQARLRKRRSGCARCHLGEVRHKVIRRVVGTRSHRA